MQPILRITIIRSDDENQLAYQVTITQGADQISTEEDMLEHLKNTIPAQNGIIRLEQLSPSIWKIISNKN